MMWKILILVTLLVFESVHGSKINELLSENLLQFVNHKTETNLHRAQIAKWNYNANLSQENLETKLLVDAEVAEDTKKLWNRVIETPWQTFEDYKLKRQFQKYSKLGINALPDKPLKRYHKIIGMMENIYSTSKICSFSNSSNCNMDLHTDLLRIFKTSNNPDELRYIWYEWRNKVGPSCRKYYAEFVTLLNEAARLNNFTNHAEYVLDTYEDLTFRDTIEDIWVELKPLYMQLHAYMRYHLRKKYGDIVSEKGPIPAHLLGNMWVFNWINLASFTMPVEDKHNEDFTEELQKQGYTPVKIFKTAEDFFTSISLPPMPESFWNLSILQENPHVNMICYPSCWDFQDGHDYRIKQCTQITMENFKTAHHEMGHLEYFMQYKDLPVMFRTPAIDGICEAVGQLISLSIQSRKHLRKLGLLKEKTDDHDNILNNLYLIGLDKIALLPFAYVVDLWRWDVYSGKIKPEDYNCKWWELVIDYQGIEPPVDRSEEDFDPAGTYHIIANIPFIKYFMSNILQFQFHKALCERAGLYNSDDPNTPLSECDLYGHKSAGKTLKKMLAMGSSEPWQEAIKEVIGEGALDSGPFLEYFKPLQDWLEKENKKNGVFVGWETPTHTCKK